MKILLLIFFIVRKDRLSAAAISQQSDKWVGRVHLMRECLSQAISLQHRTDFDSSLVGMGFMVHTVTLERMLF
jgi:hypothetical protein